MSPSVETAFLAMARECPKCGSAVGVCGHIDPPDIVTEWGIDYGDGLDVIRADEETVRRWAWYFNERGPGGATVMQRTIVTTPWRAATDR